MANRPLPSWAWLLAAAGLLVFAILWLSQDDAAEGRPGPASFPGRRAVPEEGDFSSVRRDRPIEPRERPTPSIVPRPESEPAAGGGGNTPGR